MHHVKTTTTATALSMCAMFMVISGCGTDNNTSTQPTQDMSVADMRDMSGREEMGCEGNTCEDQGLDTCGDGMKTGDEECDDGNLTSGDGCSDTCQKESVQSVCGDGMKTGDEACDEGPNPDAACPYGEMSCEVCTSGCALVAGTVSYCGDGILQDDEGELCDEGEQNSDDGPCLPDCSHIVPVKIFGGSFNTYALMSNGTVYAWGNNDYGQLGDGTTTSRAQPALLPGFENVVDIAGGGHSMCALLENGEVWCIGRGENGQLGHGAFVSSSTPVKILNVDKAKELVGYNRHYCTIDSNDKLWCWGRDSAGALGTPNDYMDQSEPMLVDLSDTVLDVATGVNTCAITSDHSVWCWGKNRSSYGEEDDSGFDRAPELIDDMSEATELVALSYSFIYKRTSDSEYYGVGDNRNEELNTLTSEPIVYEPLKINNLTPEHKVYSGNRHACSLSPENVLACWGAKTYQQISRKELGVWYTEVPEVQNAQHVGPGARHTCAIDGNHDVWCWGSNEYGQLGFEPSEDLFGPQKINLWPTP